MSKVNCVLLIDDDGITNFINFKIVKKLNICHNIHSEINGEKALNFIQFYSEKNNYFCPELIIVDMKMPVLDGFEFLEYLRIKKFNNKKDIKVIVLSAAEPRLSKEKYFNQFQLDFIQKPLTEEKLKAVLFPREELIVKK